jgi:uncharacterized protein YdcH (DUF465 family)
MVHNHDEVKRAVADENPEYRKLMDQHAGFDSRLEELQGKAALDEAERIETVNLKKQKLLLKDRMERILQDYIERTASAGARH